MLTTLLALALAQSPTMGGVPVSVIGRSAPLDYATSLYLVDPSGAALCADANITTDQNAAITVTRATAALCEIAAGNITTISNNHPVVEADGLRVEAASSNRVAFSSDMEINWTCTNAGAGVGTTTSPAGTTIASIATSVSGGYCESPAFTITGTSAVASIWIKGTGTETYDVILRDTTAGANRCAMNGTAPASWPAMKSRPSCSGSGTIVSGNSHVMRVYPGSTGGEGTLYFYGAQTEPAITTKTSYMHTSGSVVARNADNVSTTVTSIVASGCLSATVWANVAAFPARAFSNPDTIAEYGGATTIFANDGTNTANSNGVSSMSGRSATMRVLWGGSAMQAGLDGSLGTAASFDGSMGSGTTLYLGSLSGTSNYLGGWIKKLKVGTSSTGCAL